MKNTLEKSKMQGHIVLAKSNNRLIELNNVDMDDETIEFLDTTNEDGHRVYMRSLAFLFVLSCKRLLNGVRVCVEHSISGGTYCTIRSYDNEIQIGSEIKNKIKDYMRQIVSKDLPINKLKISNKEAIEFFQNNGRKDRAELLNYKYSDYTNIYELDGYRDYLHGYMVPSTGYLIDFDLELFNKGIVILGPKNGKSGTLSNFIPQHKLADIYNEYERWAVLQGVENVASLNKIINNGKFGELCRMSESLQQSKIYDIAKIIHHSSKKIVLIAAPSSSGKTSFAYKLKNALMVMGLRPVSISVDDYFVDREKTPLDDEGNYDFENVNAIDLELFNKDLNTLISGGEISKISFDFQVGKRFITDEKLKVANDQPIIIEGIHCLNPKLVKEIDDEYKFKIYISVITQVNLDDHNRIPTTDLRLMRRMARDIRSRGKSALMTIREWPLVRRGERRNIFPYQEQADIVFNSSSVIDIPVLKPIVMPLLQQIHESEEGYIEALRLMKLLQYFTSVEDNSDIVNTAILREFIGGSKIVDA